MSGSQKSPFARTVSRPGKAPERSNFAHTCNLLSQYVKDRGTARNLNLAGIASKPDALAKPEESKATTAPTTLDLLNNIENYFQLSSQNGKSVDPFSQSAPLPTTSCASEHATGEASSSMEVEALEPKKPQMTIFYDGKVIVFDDLPAGRVKEIMLLAGSGTYNGDNVCGNWKTANYSAEKLSSDEAAASSAKEQTPLVPPTAAPTAAAKEPLKPPQAQTTLVPPTAAKEPLKQPQAQTTLVPPTAEKEPLKQPQAEANSSDLPIARRSSLHRFLAKRKDRAVARGPYQLHNNNNNDDRPESSSKNDPGQLELKL